MKLGSDALLNVVLWRPESLSEISILGDPKATGVDALRAWLAASLVCPHPQTAVHQSFCAWVVSRLGGALEVFFVFWRVLAEVASHDESLTSAKRACTAKRSMENVTSMLVLFKVN